MISLGGNGPQGCFWVVDGHIGDVEMDIRGGSSPTDGLSTSPDAANASHDGGEKPFHSAALGSRRLGREPSHLSSLEDCFFQTA